MTKPTIKSLQAEIATLRELREYDKAKTVQVNAQIIGQAGIITDLKAKISELETQVRWHRQMNQHLVGKIPGARH